MTKPTQIRIRHFMFYALKPYHFALGIMVLVSLVWAIDLSLRPYIIKVILNRLAEHPQHEIVASLMVPVLWYLALTFLLSTVYRLYGYYVEIKMIPPLRQRIAEVNFALLIQQSHHFYQNQFSGSLTNKINDLINSIPEIIQIVIDRFFSHAVAVMIAIYTLWMVNVKFALTMIIWTVLFVGVSLIFSKRLAQLSDEWSEMSSVITGKIVDVLSNILSVKLFSQQKKEQNDLAATFTVAVKAEQKLQWRYFWIWLLYGYSFVVMQAFNFYFLMKGREQGTISVGDFALILIITTTIVDFLWNLAKDFSSYSKLVGKVTQALRVTEAPIDLQDAPDAKELVVTRGEIVFDRVHFKYQSAELLFEDKSVLIPSGEKVGLVGYSGSGKTTFINLILRLFDVTEGRILIDGQDIRAVTQTSLRRAIGMIPQDPLLFHRSLLENIRYGRPSASDEEVFAAAKLAYADDFIMNLPRQYESLVGERGVKLSGGQRQRIAIARAILKNAPILILDEATSQLDSITESQIQESLWRLMQGKTTIIVAHRLSTLLHMDRIIVFDQGVIVQDGPHEALLQDQQGLYKSLWDAQVGGFLQD